MEKELQLEIPLLLPQVEDEKDQCVERLLERVRSQRGIVQAHVERKDGEGRSARAGHEQQVTATDLLEKQAALEVRQAYDRYRLYRELLEARTGEQPESVLQIAQFSYAEGEMPLIELLDGVRAYSEAFQSRFDLLLKYQLSIFELEKAAAISMANF